MKQKQGNHSTQRLKSRVIKNSAFGANGLKSQVLRNSAFGGAIAILLMLGIVANVAISAGNTSDLGVADSRKSSSKVGESTDLSDIWKWQNCDCKFENALDINALTKEQKVAFSMCGSPQMVVISASDLANAYSLYRASENDSALLETLPNSDKTYSAKNTAMSKKLKILAKDTYAYSFSNDRKELKLQIHGVSNKVVFFFELENGKVKIVRTTSSF